MLLPAIFLSAAFLSGKILFSRKLPECGSDYPVIVAGDCVFSGPGPEDNYH
ncbi:hypothetical protein [Methanosarcina mazei]|uniref:hypothetical protein n=1 Tax=Methanosarcina mazei TaxID=2209 RepID=UPI000AF6E820|nr:hypothetical protein [Methanosarcina mazei]WIM47015.1 hypothetical protein PQQ20_01635 [Methanosarcina mazei]